MQTDKIKDIFLNILEAAYQPSDVVATQQLGVNLSNSIRKDGVVIIQNQNVEICARIVPLIVSGLKLCDQTPVIDVTQTLLPAPIEQIETTVSEDPVEECCNWLFNNKFGLTDMTEFIRRKYLHHVTGRFSTKAEAARMLKVGPTYLSKLTSSKEVEQ